MDIFHSGQSENTDIPPPPPPPSSSDSIIFENIPPFPSRNVPLEEALKSGSDYEDYDYTEDYTEDYSNVNQFRDNNIQPVLTETLDLSEENNNSNKPRLKFSPDLPAGSKTSPLQVTTTAKPDASPANTLDDKSNKRRKRPKRPRTKTPLVVVGPGSDRDGLVSPQATDKTRTNIINNSRSPQIIIIPQKSDGATNSKQILVNFDPEGTISNILSGSEDRRESSGIAGLRTDVGNDDQIDQTRHKQNILEEAQKKQQILIEQLMKSMKSMEKMKKIEAAMQKQSEVLKQIQNENVSLWF